MFNSRRNLLKDRKQTTGFNP